MAGAHDHSRGAGVNPEEVLLQALHCRLLQFGELPALGGARHDGCDLVQAGGEFRVEVHGPIPADRQRRERRPRRQAQGKDSERLYGAGLETVTAPGLRS